MYTLATTTLKRLFKHGVIGILLLGVLGIIGCTTPVHAESNSDLPTVNPYILLDTSNGVDEIANSVNKISSATDQRFNLLSVSDSSNKTKVTFNKRPYLKLYSSDKKDLMESTMQIVQNSAMGERDKNRLITFLEEQDEGIAREIRFLSKDTSVDIVSASRLIEPFHGTIGVILGLIALFTLISLGLSLGLDSVYMASPFVYTLMHKSGDGEKPKIISQEAYSAVLDSANSIGTGTFKSAFSFYFRRRVGVLFLVSISIGFLISGDIYRLVSYFADVFSNFADYLDFF